MGRVRAWDFDAVIGVGGLGSEASSHRLDDKVNWIGIGARKTSSFHGRGPIVTFDRFVLYEADGPLFHELAPVLAKRLYGSNVRVLLRDISRKEQKEVARILRLARNGRPSARADARARSNAERCYARSCGITRRCS
jgi:hypothetical protein